MTVAQICLMFVFYCILLSPFWVALIYAFLLKKYVCAVNREDEYALIGIVAFTEKGIERKLDKLHNKYGWGIETRFGNNRYVNHFPKYLSPMDIYWFV